MSPSELLDLYKSLIEELENFKTKGVFEWVYEDLQTDYTRVLIQKVADDDLLKENVLKDEFLEKIVLLDVRLEKFIRTDFQNVDWKKNFKPDYIDWERVNDE